MKIYYGDDRAKAERMIKRELGNGYEVIEGESLTLNDMPSVFLGMSLFSEIRNILIKDLGVNKECFSELIKYANSNNKVILWESKLDKRTNVYKELKKAGVAMVECASLEPAKNYEVFDVLEMAMKGNGEKAVRLAEKIEKTQDPFMFVGLLATQAIKKYETRQGGRERQVLKELADLDVKMKTTAEEPWNLIKVYLLRIAII